MLWEALKKPFLKPEDTVKKPSSETRPEKVDRELTDVDDVRSMSFTNMDSGFEFSISEGESLLNYQAKLIDSYRKLANNSEVSNAIDIIVNEMVWTVDNDELKIDIDEENDTIQNKISETFEKIQKLLNFPENIHPLCRQLYIDGQLNVSLIYDESDKKTGIKKAQILSPKYLYFDKDANIWKFLEKYDETTLYDTTNEFDETYSIDEMVHVDFGLKTRVKISEKERFINLSYLENVQSIANRLNTLENMLVPMRYSRSVSRRLFNVDVADLPPKKAQELMNKIRQEFKYKKVFDTETGLIKNMNSSQPLVEDYWLANRNGARGTTVELLDEKGGLMDMEDIIFTARKLYAALKIPKNRNPYEEDNGSFSYDDNVVTNDDIQFFLFVERLRLPITKLIKEILKRELIYTGVMTQKEWEKYKDKIKVSFTSASVFLENMKSDLVLKRYDNLNQLKENGIIGTIISLQKAVETTLGITSTDLEEEFEIIQKEKQDPKYSLFYKAQEEDQF